MNDSTRADFDSRRNEVYRAIGRFAVSFEQMVELMLEGIYFPLTSYGVPGEIANAILAEQTAYPIFKMFRAVSIELRPELNAGEEKAIFKNVLNRIEKLIEARNDILHRTWFIGLDAVVDSGLPPHDAWGLKHKNRSGGVEFDPRFWEISEFDAKSEECDRLAELIKTIWFSIQNQASLTKNVRLNDSGKAERV